LDTSVLLAQRERKRTKCPSVAWTWLCNCIATRLLTVGCIMCYLYLLVHRSWSRLWNWMPAFGSEVWRCKSSASRRSWKFMESKLSTFVKNIFQYRCYRC